MKPTDNLPSKAFATPPAIAGGLKPPSLSDIIRTKVSNVLTGKKADDFITAVISLTNQDPKLKKCDNTSLAAAALQAQSLNLALHKSLGQAFIVPYEDRKNKRLMATFQLGYKGYIQLAIRSGYYRKINVLAIKEGELKHYDPLTEDIEVELMDDAADREDAPSVGYYCMFEYLNGFRKTMYWSKKKMEAHALRYSKAYVSDKKNRWDNSFWTKDFDAMALKTMLRQILSKWGVMSVELQTAYDKDYRVMTEGGAGEDIVDAEFTDALDDSADATPDDLNAILGQGDSVVEGEFEVPAADQPPVTAGKPSEPKSAAPPPPEEPELPYSPTPSTVPCPNRNDKPVDEMDCAGCKHREGCLSWA